MASPDPELTYQITSGSLVYSDTFTGTLTRNPGEDVGSYAILQGTLALSVNYDLTYVGNNLNITPADPTCEVAPYDVAYDGEPHTATGACLGVNGEPLAGLELSGTTHTNAGTYTDPWTFTDVTGNYNDFSGTVTDSISKADPTCEVTPYDLTYDGNSHTATGACLGVDGEPLAGLDLSSTAHTDAGVYTDPWTFVDLTGNYNDLSGTVTDSISKADPTCEVTLYNVSYDGDSHTATGVCLGVDGEPLAGLDLSGTAHTNVGVYTDQWTFTDVTGNYNDLSGTVTDSISKADPTCEVTPYDVNYDGGPHTATGDCLGVDGEPLTGLDLSGTTHTDVGDYPDDLWTFTDVTGNYNDLSGTVADSISKADPTCELIPYDVTYDGNSHTATGACLGVDGEPLAGLDLTGTAHTDAGVYTDPWTFVDLTGNYNDLSGMITDSISKADPTCEVTPYDLTYDGDSHTATGACTGLMDEPLVGLDLSGTTQTNAGTYSDPWTFTDVTGNYNNLSGMVTDNIAPVDIIILADPQSKIYGDPDPELTYQVTEGSLVPGDSFSGMLTRDLGEDVGSYTILQGSLMLSPNYVLTYLGNDLTITPRAITVTADPQTKFIGQPDPELTYTVTEGALVTGDAFTGTLVREPGEVTGTYAILQGTLGLTSNYELAYVSNILTIPGARYWLPIIIIR